MAVSSKEMRVCASCGESLPQGIGACPVCGPSEAQAEGQFSNARIYFLLSAANLARMRGQWDHALENCVDALRLDPEDATAHSLLGDIYSDQGRREEAIQWYQMALDLNPGNEADRAKLERLRHPLEPLQEPTRPSFGVRVGVPAAVILAFLMMLVGVWAFLSSQQDEDLPLTGKGEPPPLNLPSGLRPSENRPTLPRFPFGGNRSKGSASFLMETAREAQLRDALYQELSYLQNNPTYTLKNLEVRSDPATQTADISVLLLISGRIPPSKLVELAAATARRAYASDVATQTCSVRVLFQNMRETHPVVAFAAHTTRPAFVSGGDPSQALSNLWWNSTFYPSMPAAPTGSPPPSPFSSRTMEPSSPPSTVSVPSGVPFTAQDRASG